MYFYSYVNNPAENQLPLIPLFVQPYLLRQSKTHVKFASRKFNQVNNCVHLNWHNMFFHVTWAFSRRANYLFLLHSVWDSPLKTLDRPLFPPSKKVKIDEL